MTEAVDFATDFLKRPIFSVNGMTLTVGIALVVGVLIYLAFFRK